MWASEDFFWEIFPEGGTRYWYGSTIFRLAGENSFDNLFQVWAVVVTQLVVRSLPILEVRGSNLVTGKKLYIEHLFSVNCIEKTKIKKKDAGNGPFKKINFKI